jgi:redox-sensitive bicupin YhaK (pirin superfamily)
VVPAGSVAVLSTGDGVEHSEVATDDGPCRFVQVWLRSDDLGPVGYDVRAATPAPGRLVELAEPLPGATLSLGALDAGVPLTLPGGPDVHAYVVSGSLLRSSMAEPLSTGDAFEMTGEPDHELHAGVPVQLLVWTFPATTAG